MFRRAVVRRSLQPISEKSEVAVAPFTAGNLTRPGRNNLALPEGEPQPLHYDILGIKMGAPLREVKLKYLVACRRYHPECGGDPEMFLRASLAYQDVLKDYGLESVRGEVVNLGNFQADTYMTRTYLQEREKITTYIPMSSLDEHIARLEEAQSKMSYDMEKRLTANDTDAMWLLEDIDTLAEKTRSDTFTLRLSESGEITAHEDKNLLESGGESKVLIGERLPPKLGAAARASDASHDGNEAQTEADSQGKKESWPDDISGSSSIVETVTLTKADVLALNAKHMVQHRDDIAGEASRTATTVMRNTREAREITETLLLFLFLLCGLGLLLYVALEAWSRADMAASMNSTSAGQLNTDTMMPWWGNDSEYEKQVKRIFVEEWRRARASARKTQIFQDGISRESLPADVKENLDLSIFTVTSDKLRELKAHADAQPGKM